MGDHSEFQVGQTVELQDGRIATVRYVGSTHFSAGEWIGVELEDTTGKNDGAVQGQRYFDCEPGRGMFVRPSVAAIIEQPSSPMRAASIITASKVNGKVNGMATKPRQGSIVAGGLRRQSVLDPPQGKRRSIFDGSPTPSAKSAAVNAHNLRSPSKSPTKQLGSTASSGTSTPRSSTMTAGLKSNTAAPKPRGSISGRPSMGPPATSRPSRPSTFGGLNGQSNPSSRPPLSSARRPINRLSTLQNPGKSTSPSGRTPRDGGFAGHESSSESQGHEILSPSSEGGIDGNSPAMISPQLSRASATSRSVLSPPNSSSYGKSSPPKGETGQTPPSTALGREVESLKTKLRMMEKKRLEDREKLKALERLQEERDRFEGIIQKLQIKYQPQQQEIADLKKQLREAEARIDGAETQKADFDTTVEMALLDREMAEETAESLKTELDALRQKFEELELEVDVLREENAELGKEMSPEEKTSQGWLQMERSNERLREALMRLRDLTQQQEADLKLQVKELEDDLQQLSDVKGQLEESKERVAQSDATIEDLRQQLDTALGAEEMIEELTEKNLGLNEQVDELRAIIEDLESLKELNDELEINHIETEKQMQDEIDYKEMILLEQAKRGSAQDGTIDDLEYTVSRFRDLVTNLQSDLEDMRASQQITETEANELTNRSRAMMDLNMRLQLSASKAQVKAVDLELRRLEARESEEHLAILQRFLPDIFHDDRESIQAYLRIKRIGFKSSLMHTFIKERVNAQATPDHEDEVFNCCEILDKLTWVSTMCERFIRYVQHCSAEAFNKIAGALYDLEPVERALNGWIEGLKQDDLKLHQCSTELQRSIALMMHLAEVHIGEGLEHYADDVYARTMGIQSCLENAASAINHIKNIAQSKIPSHTDDNEEDEQERQTFSDRADLLVSQMRSVKVVVTKAIHQLEELNSRSLTLDPSTLPTIEQLQSAVSEIGSTAQASGLSVFRLVNEEGRTTPITYDEVTQAISPSDSMPFSTLASKLQIAASQVQSFLALTSNFSQTIEFSSPAAPPPWERLAHKLHTAKITSEYQEREVGRLRDELQEKSTAIMMKDKILEEMSVNVEILEKRVGESGGRRERLRELEGTVETARTKERELTKKLTRLQNDLQTAELERDDWKRRAAQPNAHYGGGDRPSQPGDLDAGGGGGGGGMSHATSIASQLELLRLKSEVSTLQSTIRHLHLSSHHASFASAHSFLSVPLIPERHTSQRDNLAHEARDVFKAMLDLATRPESQVVVLTARDRDDRLKWRPARELTRWQVDRRREEWETWREWRDEVGQKVQETRREEERQRMLVGEAKGKGQGLGTGRGTRAAPRREHVLATMDDGGGRKVGAIKEVEIVGLSHGGGNVGVA